jgi:hypothetical protein
MDPTEGAEPGASPEAALTASPRPPSASGWRRRRARSRSLSRRAGV